MVLNVKTGLITSKNSSDWWCHNISTYILKTMLLLISNSWGKKYVIWSKEEETTLCWLFLSQSQCCMLSYLCKQQPLVSYWGLRRLFQLNKRVGEEVLLSWLLADAVINAKLMLIESVKSRVISNNVSTVLINDYRCWCLVVHVHTSVSSSLPPTSAGFFFLSQLFMLLHRYGG